MRNLCAVLVLGLFLGATATPVHPVTHRPMCDSPEVEEAANSALDYINSHHKHGFKYALNRIEDAKVITPPTGGEVYILELDLLQTTCHVLDPTPLANCTVRPKLDMTVEGDCDVAVAKAADGTLTLKAFKCKAEPGHSFRHVVLKVSQYNDISPRKREDLCAGCPIFLPLNHTEGLQMVHLSVATFHKQANRTTLLMLLEVLRLTSQVLSGGARLEAEFVMVETNCSGDATEGCTPLQGPETDYALCKSSSFGQQPEPVVSCKLFHTAPAPVAPPETKDAAAAGDAVVPGDAAAAGDAVVSGDAVVPGDAAAAGDAVVSVDTAAGALPAVPLPLPHLIVPFLPHGGVHHKMTHLHIHDPSGTGLLSESTESKEVPVVKREAPVAPDVPPLPDVAHILPMGPGIQLCPGRIRHF